MPVSAQIDQEFWFAPPDLTQGTQSEINGNAYRDRPIQLVISTLTDAAQVTIWQPANLSFTPIVVNLNASSTTNVNLTPWINQIETRFPDSVMNTGILVRATAPITAYYELGAAANRDLVALKGRNGTGTLFYTPFQTLWENARTLGGLPYIPQPRSGFLIVATDDTTNVTITPSIDILNHQAGIPFTIQLHRGQTYYCEALDYLPASKPAGSKIESDKPITVTIKDDMLDLNPPPIGTEGGADLAADQLISVENCGFKHIVVKGDLTNPSDKVYVCATEDGTDIFIDGNDVTPVATLNAGQQYIYSFTDNAGFIRGSKPIYVLHLSGVGDQIAGAVIPSLECTGSNQIGFTRTGTANFKLNLTIKAGFEGNFVLNGNNTYVTAADFQPVPGTNGEWVYCRKAFTTAEIPVGQGSLIQNFSAELFHMGITYQQGASCNYGYFSNFSYLELGINRALCLGDSAVLDAGPGKTSYLWSTGDTTQKITVFDAGTYFVSVLSGNECSATDTISVSYYEPPVNIQAARDTICEGTQLLLTVPGTYLFEWQDGTTNPFFIVQDSGIYYVEVTDFQGCRARDSIQIWTSPRPPSPVANINPFDASVTSDTLCAGQALSMSMTSVPDVDSYGWFGPGNTLYNGQDLDINAIAMNQAGNYLAFAMKDGCESFFDSLSIFVNPTPEVYIGLSDTVCDQSTILLDAGAGPGYTYVWQDNSTNQTFTVTASGDYWVEVSNPLGCSRRDSVELVFSTTPPAISVLTNGEDVNSEVLCTGSDLQLLSATPVPQGIFYWITPSDTIVSGSGQFSVTNLDLSQAGQYGMFYMLNGCPSASDLVDISLLESPVFEFGFADTSICGGTAVLLDASGPSDVTYTWSDNSQNATLNATTSGIYWVDLSNSAGCTTRDSVTVNLLPRPEAPQISGDTTLCGTQALALNSNQQPNVIYTWNTPAGQTVGGSLNLSEPQAGAYTLSASLDGCESATNDAVTVFVFTEPSFSLGDDQSICVGDVATLAGPAGMDAYDWSNDESTASIEVGAGSYTLTVTDQNGCTFEDAIVITEGGPVAAFVSDPTTGAQSGATIVFTDQSTGSPVSWNWNFGDNASANTQNTSHAYASQGEITVILEVTDAAGCTDTAMRVYTISNSVAVPNSFTPNGDGFNDQFVVKGLAAFPESSLNIFNRWGNEVYSTADYLNNWTGDDLPDGVYFYVLKLSNGEALSGDITLKRK
jgi:gliding motility-associated-like protein